MSHEILKDNETKDRKNIPNGTDISKVTDEKTRKIRRKINARPRKNLIFLHRLKSFPKIFRNVTLAG